MEGRNESVRKKIVSLVFIIYWLLIFEGALRKWAFPEFEKLLFFIRDPFVLMVYLLAFKYRFLPRNSKLLFGASILSVFMLFFSVLQMITVDLNPLIALYGWRNYFFYVPLAFIIGECFNRVDFARLQRQSLIVAIPMAILVYIQFLSPSTSFINKAINEDAWIFMVSVDMVRTTGTFTFTTGHSIFVGSVAAMLLAVWLLPAKSRPIKGKLLWMATGAVATMVALSGSRTVFFYVSLIMLATFISGLLVKKAALKMRAIRMPVFLALFGAFVFVFVFPTSFEVMSERQADAIVQEGSTMARAFGVFHNFVGVLPEAPAIGYGLGFGTGGGSTLATGSAQFTLAEDEWSRIILEVGPFMGAFYIFFRIALVSSLLAGAFKTARVSDEPTSLILLGFIGMTLLNGVITMQGTVNGYGWLFCGLCLAGINMGQVAEVKKPGKTNVGPVKENALLLQQE